MFWFLPYYFIITDPRPLAMPNYWGDKQIPFIIDMEDWVLVYESFVSVFKSKVF